MADKPEVKKYEPVKETPKAAPKEEVKKEEVKAEKPQVVVVSATRSQQELRDLSVQYNFAFACPHCEDRHVLSSVDPKGADLVAAAVPCGHGKVTVKSVA